MINFKKTICFLLSICLVSCKNDTFATEHVGGVSEKFKSPFIKSQVFSGIEKTDDESSINSAMQAIYQIDRIRYIMTPSENSNDIMKLVYKVMKKYGQSSGSINISEEIKPMLAGSVSEYMSDQSKYWGCKGSTKLLCADPDSICIDIFKNMGIDFTGVNFEGGCFNDARNIIREKNTEYGIMSIKISENSRRTMRSLLQSVSVSHFGSERDEKKYILKTVLVKKNNRWFVCSPGLYGTWYKCEDSNVTELPYTIDKFLHDEDPNKVVLFYEKLNKKPIDILKRSAETCGFDRLISKEDAQKNQCEFVAIKRHKVAESSYINAIIQALYQVDDIRNMEKPADDANDHVKFLYSVMQKYKMRRDIYSYEINNDLDISIDDELEPVRKSLDLMTRGEGKVKHRLDYLSNAVNKILYESKVIKRHEWFDATPYKEEGFKRFVEENVRPEGADCFFIYTSGKTPSGDYFKGENAKWFVPNIEGYELKTILVNQCVQDRAFWEAYNLGKNGIWYECKNGLYGCGTVTPMKEKTATDFLKEMYIAKVVFFYTLKK